ILKEEQVRERLASAAAGKKTPAP
ncbi:unnamed protein product, partial [Allacma fusca]